MEDDDGWFVLHKHNCPYAGMSGEHHELCLMDQLLINRLVGMPCERTASVANHDLCCTYQIGNPSQIGNSSDGQTRDALVGLTVHSQEIMLVA